jgi:taurine-pyruvate aminotransferase
LKNGRGNKAMATEWEAQELTRQDKEHLWHHLTQHRVFETAEPMIVVEGKGLLKISAGHII